MNNEMVGEKIPELKEIVFLQDSDFSKTMQEMEKFMKSFGQNIKESEPYEELQNYDDNLMKMKETLDIEEELLKDFEVLDESGSGYLSILVFRFVIKQMDHKFTDTEIEEMIIESEEMGEGRINYKKMFKNFCN